MSRSPRVPGRASPVRERRERPHAPAGRVGGETVPPRGGSIPHTTLNFVVKAEQAAERTTFTSSEAAPRSATSAPTSGCRPPPRGAATGGTPTGSRCPTTTASRSVRCHRSGGPAASPGAGPASRHSTIRPCVPRWPICAGRTGATGRRAGTTRSAARPHAGCTAQPHHKSGGPRQAGWPSGKRPAPAPSPSTDDDARDSWMRP